MYVMFFFLISLIVLTTVHSLNVTGSNQNVNMNVIVGKNNHTSTVKTAIFKLEIAIEKCLCSSLC